MPTVTTASASIRTKAAVDTVVPNLFRVMGTATTTTTIVAVAGMTGTVAEPTTTTTSVCCASAATPTLPRRHRWTRQPCSGAMGLPARGVARKRHGKQMDTVTMAM